MALSTDRVEHLTELTYFLDEVSERGIMLIHDTGGDGAAMDDPDAKVKQPASLGADVQSGNPAGLLLNDQVDKDLAQTHLNAHKDEMQVGGKCLLLRRGTVVTDQVSGTPVVGEDCHYTLTGQLVGASTDTTSAKVGRFLSVKDSRGYAKVEINIV